MRRWGGGFFWKWEIFRIPGTRATQDMRNSQSWIPASTRLWVARLAPPLPHPAANSTSGTASPSARREGKRKKNGCTVISHQISASPQTLRSANFLDIAGAVKVSDGMSLRNSIPRRRPSAHLDCSRLTTGIDYRHFLPQAEGLRRRMVKVCHHKQYTTERSANWQSSRESRGCTFTTYPNRIPATGTVQSTYILKTQLELTLSPPLSGPRRRLPLPPSRPTGPREARKAD